MTWQRIDDDTYIDDTLVTCAEYQLFIDEMREQGKYYQPDHWGSYQYPDGHALEVILGIRESDAVAFCEWLTRRSLNDQWKYRLPTKTEMLEIPLIKRSLPEGLVGCWINDDAKFFRIANFASNQYRPDFSDESRGMFQDSFNSEFGFRVGVLPYAREFSEGKKFLRQLDVTRVREDTLQRALKRPLNLDRHREIAGDLYDLYFALMNERQHMLASATASKNFDGSLVFEDLKRNQQREITIARNTDLEHALDKYIDLFTIQERFYGRYPSFESIRIVRERNL